MTTRRVSLAFRTALASAAAVLSVCLLGFGIVYWRAADRLDQELRGTVERTALREIVSYFPPETKDVPTLEDLVERVRLRNAASKDGVLLVLLDAFGRIEAGRMPGRVEMLQACVRRVVEHISYVACGRSWRLRNRDESHTLVISQPLPQGTPAPSEQAIALLLVAIVAAPFAGGVGFIVSRRLERRLAGVSLAAQSLMGGELGQRLPQSGTGDEFDRLVDTVNAMLDRIALLMRDLSLVTDFVAHEMRTPLFRARQSLEAMAADASGEAAQRVATTLAELDRANRIFDAVLETTRVEKAPTARLDLSEIVEGVGELFEGMIEHGQTLDVVVDPGLHVMGNRQLLAQAIDNLIRNALRHGGPGVHVRVALKAEDGRAVLTIVDDGPGIPEAERARVLEPGQRLDAAKAGHGLGLTLVAAVARRHGARLMLGDAAPGLRVTLGLPIA